MASYKSSALIFILSFLTADETCFAFISPNNIHPPINNPTTTTTTTTTRRTTSLSTKTKTTTTTKTRLHALTAPTLIIGPMIRKMREENEKKNAPMVSDDEKYSEAPGLKVGSMSWKWPPIWPYEGNYFMRKEDIAASSTPAMNPVSGLLTGGMPNVPTSSENPDNDSSSSSSSSSSSANGFNVLKYWDEEKAGVATELDSVSAQRIINHHDYYLRDGKSVIEFGAAEESYLPENLKLARHVGVGASMTQMNANPKLTERMVVDLNNVENEFDVESDDLRKMANTFDFVLMSNTVDFLTSPREVFRSAWNVLKPGGTMIVSFSSKDAYAAKFEKAQTRMWRDMNDDQHMWIIGSFFQFSAGEGWDDLLAFDISPDNAQKDDNNPLGGLLNRGKPAGVYVVQAKKGYMDESIDESDPEKSIRSKMWMLPTMESRDKELVAPRLSRAYSIIQDAGKRTAMAKSIETLPKIYESLIKMDQFAFTFSMQAQLAADLVTDGDFAANDEQIAALKMGLGLRKPSETFWAPVGSLTSAMDGEDKINLLAHIVPRFGSGNPDQDEALDAFVSGLKPTFDLLRSKCPDMSEADIQLLGSELLAAEILIPGRSTREEFAAWLGAMDEVELKSILSKRKEFKETAVNALKAMRAERDAELARAEAIKKKMEEQVNKAREERTVKFNMETGRIEPVTKNKKKT